MDPNFWTDPTLFVFGFLIFLIGVAIPLMLISFIMRLLGRSFSKTARTIFRK